MSADSVWWRSLRILVGADRVHPDANRAYLRSDYGLRKRCVAAVFGIVLPPAQVEKISPIDLSEIKARGEALASLGQFREAEAILTQSVNEDVLATASVAQRIDLQLAQLRNQRALGHFTLAKSLATSLLASVGENEMASAVIPARLELAVIGLAMHDHASTSAAATEVVRHYSRRGLPGHVNAIEATTLLKEVELELQAQVELDVLEVNPDRAAWSEGETKLRELLADAQHALGVAAPGTFTIAVAHLWALISIGEPDRALAEYSNLPIDLKAVLGARHRLYLRTRFLLGQAYAQRRDIATATEAYEEALSGQAVVLGPGHPETLRTRYELGVVRWLAGEVNEARALFRSVRHDVTADVRADHLYSQAVIAERIISMVPPSVLRILWRLDRRKQKKE